MGKPSKASLNNDTARQRHRRRQYKQYKEQLMNQIKIKEEIISDLQIQHQELQKFIEKAGKETVHELNKCYHERETMLKWMEIYTQQIKNQERELYDLRVKLYIKDQNISNSAPPTQPPLQPSSQLSQPKSQPFFKSLDEYFKYEQEQEK